MGLVRGGDDDVLPGAEAEALRHLAQVDVGLAARLGGAVQKEVLLHVLLVAVHLREGGGKGANSQARDEDEAAAC